MIIEDKRQGNLLITVKDVKIGAIFEAEFINKEQREFFMKTEEENSTHITCINLRTGKHYVFSKENEVTVLKAKIVIEE